MKLSSLLENTAIRLVGTDIELPIDIRVDSREVKKNEGFVAIRGRHVDAHRFIEDVLAKEAALVVCESGSYNPEWKEKHSGCAFILTPERCEYGLAELARNYLKKLPSLRDVVAITGSVGKTSTKNDLAELLKENFKIHVAGGNYNTLIGCSVTVLSAPTDTQVMLLEMGANHAGEIAEMVRYMSPTIAAITEIAPAHLESFGTVDGVLAAKEEILGSDNLRYAALNADNHLLDKTAKKIAAKAAKVVRFGRRGDVSFARERLTWQKDHFNVDAILTGLDKLSFKISLPLAGLQQLYPLTCAVAIAGILGLTSRQIAAAIPNCKNGAGRGEIRVAPSGAAIVDECYNASPAAVLASLNSLNSADIPGRRFLVLGEMLELGSASQFQHELVFENAIRVCDNVYLFGDEWKNLDGTKNYIFDDISELIAAVDKCNPSDGDVILIKGSRGNHLERVVRALEL